MECIVCEQFIEDEINTVDDVALSRTYHKAGIIEFTATDSETGNFVKYLIRDIGYKVPSHYRLKR